MTRLLGWNPRPVLRVWADPFESDLLRLLSLRSSLRNASVLGTALNPPGFGRGSGYRIPNQLVGVLCSIECCFEHTHSGYESPGVVGFRGSTVR